ncbi:methionine aminopeptidase [Holotrichia oblita]|nr:methionine aminopeptidase [Holotrichia oblita]
MNYLRDAGKLVAQTLNEVEKAVKPEVSTKKLDQVAVNYIKQRGGIPAFKGYNGFPGNICTSINEEVVHGIPGVKKLKSGDNISIDIGVIINGYYGDAAITVPVGDVDEEMRRLLKVTEESLYIGIEQAVPGNRLGDISNSIQVYAEKHGYGVVRDYVGHGIGRSMHEAPQIPNFGRPGRGPRLKSGMTLAIEPMLNMGTYQVKTLGDNWTVVTTDNKPSAHFEHTVAITENGQEILTKR